jgi:hypothetical protein
MVSVVENVVFFSCRGFTSSLADSYRHLLKERERKLPFSLRRRGRGMR